MPIVGPDLSQKIEEGLAPWNGVELTPFCEAIGNGLALATIGQLGFATDDVGAQPGAGVGQGTGIVGMDPTSMADVIFQVGQGFWSGSQNNGPGVEWRGFCDKISAVIVSYLAAEADLLSQHTPIFVGNGSVNSYFGLVPQTVAQQIVAQGPPAWAAWRFPELALAVATGYVTEITTHSPGSSVTIGGAFAGPVPPGPVPGNGSGVGIVL
jgi:hypothetical protein